MVRLSVLDLAYIGEGFMPADALANALDLAQQRAHALDVVVALNKVVADCLNIYSTVVGEVLRPELIFCYQTLLEQLVGLWSFRFEQVLHRLAA